MHRHRQTHPNQAPVRTPPTTRADREQPVRQPLWRRGLACLTSWLANRGVRDADSVAATAMEAAQAQQTALPGEDAAAQIVADLATQILARDDRLKRLDRQIRDAFRTHAQAEIIESLPGMGPIPGAEFIVAAGDMTAYTDAGHLASAAGLVPVPRDSGRRTGNLHRPKRYSRRLCRVFYLSAQSSIIRDGPKGTTTSRNAARAANTSKPSSPSHDAAPVCCGPSCATTGPSPPHRPDGLSKATEPAAWLRPVGLQRDTRAPDRSACPPSWLTFAG